VAAVGGNSAGNYFCKIVDIRKTHD
jgi:hypothetical protein